MNIVKSSLLLNKLIIWHINFYIWLQWVHGSKFRQMNEWVAYTTSWKKYRVIKKSYPPKILNILAEIGATRIGPWPVEKTAFKLQLGNKWMQIIPKHQTHIHDENISLFPTAVAEFEMSHLTLQQRKVVIEFMINPFVPTVAFSQLFQHVLSERLRLSL